MTFEKIERARSTPAMRAESADSSGFAPEAFLERGAKSLFAFVIIVPWLVVAIVAFLYAAMVS